MTVKRKTPGLHRKATAGIVAAVILFAMLFTVGTSFFLFINSGNLLYVRSLAVRTNAVHASLNELLTVTTLLVNSNHVGFFVNNTGGLNANLTAVWVLDSSSSLLRCDGRGLPSVSCGNSSPALPVAVNSGQSSSKIDTGYVYSSGTLVVKVFTERGGVFSASYPPTPPTLVTNALTSGALGDVYLNFNTYSYYSISTCGANSCLTKQGLAFGVPHLATSSNIAFGVRVTNLNAQQKVITLDQYAALIHYLPPAPGTGGGTARGYTWYIISNTTNVISNTFVPIVLNYNQPQTIIFATSSPGSFTGYAPAIAANTIVLISMLFHGCETTVPGSCTSSTYNYGQNVPLVTTLYT